MMAQIPTFKSILLGDVATGKTSFLKRHLTGEFQKEYIASEGAAVIPLIFYTNYGPIRFVVWDTPGHEKYNGMRECYYVNAESAIIMYDIESDLSYENVPNWYRDMRRVIKKIPTVLIANKIEIKDHKTYDENMRLHKQKNMQLYNISVKTQYKIEKLFLWLSQQLIGNADLEFVAETAHLPSEIKMNKNWKLQMEKDLQKFLKVELPEDDEDL